MGGGVYRWTSLLMVNYISENIFFELKMTQFVGTVHSDAFLSDEWSYTFLDIRGHCYQDSSGVVDGVGGFGCGPVD